MRQIAMEVFKATNGMSPTFICDMIQNSCPTHSYNLRHKNIKNSHCRTTHFGLHSFKHLSITIWNSLPHETRAFLILMFLSRQSSHGLDLNVNAHYVNLSSLSKCFFYGHRLFSLFLPSILSVLYLCFISPLCFISRSK